MGRYIFDFTPVAGGRRGGDGPVTSAAPTPAAAAEPQGGGRPSVGLSFLDKPFVLIINTAPDEYYLASNGSFPFVVSPNNIPNARVAAAATIDRGAFKNGIWVTQRRANGDDIMGRGYDVSAAANNNQPGSQIPLGPRGRGGRGAGAGDMPQPPTVIRVRLYTYR